MGHKETKDTFTRVLAVVIGILIFLILVVSAILFVRPGVRDRFSGRVVEKDLALGKRYLSEMDYEKAVTAFSDVVRVDEKNTEGYVGLGDAYSGLGQWSEAAESYDNAIETVVERAFAKGPEREERGETVVREEVMEKAALDDSGQEYIKERELEAIDIVADFAGGSASEEDILETVGSYMDPTPEVIIELVEKRNAATEKAIEVIRESGGDLSPYQDYIDWQEQKTPGEAKDEDYTTKTGENTDAADTADTEDSEDTDNTADMGTLYLKIIDKLTDRYGTLRVAENADGREEANGLCLLKLVDFTRDGVDELFAVCKNEDEDHYSGYIYTIMNNTATVIYQTDSIEYNMYNDSDVVYTGYTSDTGYIFGTGWEGDDAEDRTFYWYDTGIFKPVYRLKGYWDTEKERYITDEETVVVDLFDDEHRQEFMDGSEEITLRAPDTAEYYILSIDDLQYRIDDILQRLEASSASDADTTGVSSADSSDQSSDNSQRSLMQPYLGAGWNSQSMDANGPSYTAVIYEDYIEIHYPDGDIYRKDIHSVEREEDGVMIKMEDGDAFFGPDDEKDILRRYFDWERRSDNMSGSDSLWRSN